MSYIRNAKKLRLGLTISQQKFARLAKVDRQTLSRCENGYTVQDLSLAKIEKAFLDAGIPPSQIVTVRNGKAGEIPKKGKKKAPSKTRPTPGPTPPA